MEVTKSLVIQHDEHAYRLIIGKHEQHTSYCHSKRHNATRPIRRTNYMNTTKQTQTML